MTSYTESELVTILQKASDAYYNGTGDLILGDEEYDRLREMLEKLNPHHPFLNQIGAPVAKGAVRLPFKMASLTKVKPETGAVDSFRNYSSVKSWVLSDKLDGISVLWDMKSRKLYLRGDGMMGVDVSSFAPYLHGLTPRGFQEPWVLRGELVLPKETVVEGALSRSWVNGQLHQKKPIPKELAKIHFVSYEVLQPASLCRSDQFLMMTKAGFEVPVWCSVDTLTDTALIQYLNTRRERSHYPIDGIVVGENCIPTKDASADVVNPKDMRAFKMPLDDQRATTAVVDIVWSPSHQGYWIPRIQIQPVMIGGSRIEFLTGHNARTIVSNQIGKGAMILVRKSGDVIPTLERVVSLGSPPILPDGVWDGDPATSSHYKVKEDTILPEIYAKKLEHFTKTLEIPFLGPGLLAKLVESGKHRIQDLLNLSQTDMEDVFGKGMAVKIYPALQSRLQTLTELDLMVASSKMPRGIGSSKLAALFEREPDPRNWTSISRCEGWSHDALQSFLHILPSYEAWRREELYSLPYPLRISKQEIKPPPKEIICLTGFRDAEFQKQLEEKGFSFVPSVTKKTTVLVVKSKTDPSEKQRKAEELGIRILTREEAKMEYLGSL